MKMVYIAGKLTHPMPDVMEVRRIAAVAVGRQVEVSGPFVAFVPHVHILEPTAQTPEQIWKEAMRKCIAVLRRCDYLLPMKGWEASRGARIEVWLCKRRSGFPQIAHDLETLIAEGLDGESVA